MKKTLTLIASIVVIAAVMAAPSFAKNSNHGSSRAQIFRATLAPVTPPVGPTGPTVGSYGETGATGASGRVQWTQNKKRHNGYVKVRKLTPATTYSASIYLDVDGTGCASTTNAALNPPVIKPIVTDAAGNGKVNTHGKLSTFALDKTKDYYVRVNDAAGAAVLCGDLKYKTKKPKKSKSHGKSGQSHGKSGGKGH